MALNKKANQEAAGRVLLTEKQRKVKQFFGNWQLYTMLLPALICLVLFHYVPMYGVTIAFKDIRIGESLWEGTWVGLKHFERLFSSNLFSTIFKNTVVITLIQNFLLWPLPIIFALIVHNCTNNKIRKTVQTVSYLPHLMSVVVVVCIINLFCSQETGLINIVLQKLGLETIYFDGDSKWFLPMYFVSEVWMNMGANAVVYIAALSAVDPQLVEAAQIDGASKLKRIWHIDLPTIRPTIILLLIMSMGKVLTLGYERILLMQNDLNLPVSEIIGTYVYKTGLQGMQYSFSAAVSLFNNVVGLILVLASNYIAKKSADISLF